MRPVLLPAGRHPSSTLLREVGLHTTFCSSRAFGAFPLWLKGGLGAPVKPPQTGVTASSKYLLFTKLLKRWSFKKKKSRNYRSECEHLSESAQGEAASGTHLRVSGPGSPCAGEEEGVLVCRSLLFLALPLTNEHI